MRKRVIYKKKPIFLKLAQEEKQNANDENELHERLSEPVKFPELKRGQIIHS